MSRQAVATLIIGAIFGATATWVWLQLDPINRAGLVVTVACVATVVVMLRPTGPRDQGVTS